MRRRINELQLLRMLDVFLVLSTIICLFCVNSNEGLMIIGIIILCCSLVAFAKVRKDTLFMIMFGIILYINFSLLMEDFGLFNSTIIPSRQIALRDTEANLISAKCMLILNCVINYFLPTKKFMQKEGFTFVYKNNPLIFWVGYFVMILGLIFGFERSSGVGYTSNGNPLYEYCLIIMLMVWYYSGNNNLKRKLLIGYGIVYALQGLVYGDRSSMLPMCVLLAMMLIGTIKWEKLIPLAVIGIVLTNYIGIYRKGVSEINIVDILGNGLKVDTVTYSYYASLCIIKMKEMMVNPFIDIFDFIISIFVGGNYGNSNLSALSKAYYPNAGGGMYYSYFYYWMGYFGVLLSALIIVLVIRRIKKKENGYTQLLKICITIMCFRWYLYTPIVFYRSSLLIFTLLFFVCKVFHSVTQKKHIRT